MLENLYGHSCQFLSEVVSKDINSHNVQTDLFVNLIVSTDQRKILGEEIHMLVMRNSAGLYRNCVREFKRHLQHQLKCV